jgi:hypothetical protein
MWHVGMSQKRFHEKNKLSIMMFKCTLMKEQINFLKIKIKAATTAKQRISPINVEFLVKLEKTNYQKKSECCTQMLETIFSNTNFQSCKNLQNLFLSKL